MMYRCLQQGTIPFTQPPTSCAAYTALTELHVVSIPHTPLQCDIRYHTSTKSRLHTAVAPQRARQPLLFCRKRIVGTHCPNGDSLHQQQAQRTQPTSGFWPLTLCTTCCTPKLQQDACSKTPLPLLLRATFGKSQCHLHVQMIQKAHAVRSTSEHSGSILLVTCA